MNEPSIKTALNRVLSKTHINQRIAVWKNGPVILAFTYIGGSKHLTVSISAFNEYPRYIVIQEHTVEGVKLALAELETMLLLDQ